MDPETYWKNFDVGVELSIAAGFIYDGLNHFDKIDHYEYADEVFPVLYNLAVGVERLLKVAILLSEHDQWDDEIAFEESLITHSHLDLTARLGTKQKLNFQRPHNELLSCLAKFYKTFRYGRFSSGSVFNGGKEVGEFTDWIRKNLCQDLRYGVLPDEKFDVYRIRKYLGKIIGYIVTKIYEVIRMQAKRLNIYTYECRYESKAAKLFLFEQFDFFDEEILRNELIFHLIERYKDISPSKIFKVQPADFEEPSLEAFRSDRDKLDFHGELEQFYADSVTDVGERLEFMRYLPKIIDSVFAPEPFDE